MKNTIPTPIDASIAPQAENAPPMATTIAPPTSVLNGHTPPIGDAYGDGAVPTDLNASIEGKSDGKGGWTPGFRAKTSPERALKWERHFTAPGQDAFDTIEWEMRTAGITGEDGKSVFEQTNCEIPKPWSQLATNVVVSKYFRGPINSPDREHSVKQVIGRVADTIGLWGAQGGYFASDDDAENFRDELAYLLVHQYGAFNSPVWFNLGVKDAKQQCSACQPYDALVSTPAGLIPIGELVEKNAVGHAVYDANGVARIVAVKHNGRKEVLRFHLKSGYTLDVTGDHQVWKRTGFSQGRHTGKWVEAGTLQAEDMLAWHRTPVVDKSQELTGDVAEAALAGWLQSDGFVGRYDKGTNRSLTIEAMTVNAAEEKWVRAALDAVFPGAHSHTRGVITQDENLDCQRIRIYGDFMEPFIEKWNLMTRGNAMTVPPMLYTAPLPVVVAYLRSLFQAEGYVSVRDKAAVIALDMVSEGIVRGVQTLLGRLGIYARVRFKADARDDRQGCWSLGIRPRGDRELFAQEIGFISPEKQDKVLQSLLLEGHCVTDVKTMQIERIEVRGEMDVYDIQTTSGEYLSNGIRVHNCFINDVYDDMESIMELAATEARLFKGGSGAGVNLWRVRSSKEQLRGGGIASGPISFMRGWDAFAGAVKSGGTCLAPHQRVYTAQGPVPVIELAAREEFIALSFDPPANRYKAKRARAWLAGRKEVVRVTTDKGAFELSFDHPVKLSSGEYVQAGSLAEGMSLFACTIDTQHGHLRVGLRDGKKGKEFLHRLVAADVMNEDLDGLVVHHRDGDRLNNAPKNLQVMTQAEHAALHGRAVAARGEHVFQTQEFSHVGADNGMYRDSAFWQTEEAQAYREMQGEILKDSGRATEMQGEAARQKTLNTAFRVLNAGWKIDTFEHYVTGRKLVIGRIASIVQLREQIEAEFGSYDEFVREVARANHRVVSVETIGEMEVYDVEVQCPTADDKSPETGHNFLIWDGDEPTGSGVVVANTRRAAKMVILNVDHPDIGEFITCKAEEEKKAWALIEAGYNGGFNVPGGAYDSVDFQNANHSVRVTDEFMRAAENDGEWHLRAVTNGKVTDTKKARQMLKDIAQTTWICGDPGMQFDTIINDWHTCSNSDRIYASNPCSEFMFLNSTACNLASLNLLKFYDMETGVFDAPAYSQACETFLTAQEIIVSFASYPTKKIGEMSEQYRPLGLGYANLGALLMAKGLAYDSDEGRALAGALTAIMTGAGYRKSAQIARNTGPFEGYAANKEPMLRVIAKHRDAVNSIDASLVAENVMEEARKVWDDAYMTGQKYGYRNSQATVLAPTGTISFMMDCDTTGVEPDIALVKYKKLVGGGLLKIVNQTVPAALRNLGYDESEIKTIVDYIDKNDTIEGAPGLQDKDLSVFDCAFKAMNGTRSIHHMGHIKMMAATQPFISGAISKTVNMPQDCTADEIYDAYLQSWKMGVKAVAIYRDGSKRTQPLSTASDAQKADKADKDSVIAKKESEIRRAARRKLPDERNSITHKFSIAGQEGYFMVGLYQDGSPGEIFIKMSKEGSTISGLMDSFAVAVSMCLQYGVPLRVLVNKFSHTRFEPSGYTTNRDIPIAKSLMDYIFRWFDLKFHPNGDNGHVGKVVEANVTHAALPEASLFAPENGSNGGNHGNVGNAQREVSQMQQDAPPCPDCGALTVRSGACYKCNECGATTGCG